MRWCALLGPALAWTCHDVVLLPAHKVKPYVQGRKERSQRCGGDRRGVSATGHSHGRGQKRESAGFCDAGETACPGGATAHAKALCDSLASVSTDLIFQKNTDEKSCTIHHGTT